MTNSCVKVFPGIVLFLGAGACTTGALSIAQRIAATHNVLAPAGFGALGPISEGRLQEGASDEVQIQFEGGQCYSINAFGADGVWDIDVDVLDDDGVAVASDASRSPQASAHFCPEQDGRYTLRVSAASGAGHWALGIWSASASASAAIVAARPTGTFGTCEAPIELELGETVRGSTAGGEDRMTPRPDCVRLGASNAPDTVYLVTVPQPGMLRAELRTEYDGVLSLLSDCPGHGPSTLACNDDAEEGDTSRAMVEARVEAGTYYLVVDGYGDESGTFSLATTFVAMRDLAEVCAELRTLTPGQEVSGSTEGQADNFRTDEECAGGSRSPDVGYRLVIDEPSRVRVTLSSDYDGALAIRSDCLRQASVVACNDDFEADLEDEEADHRSQITTRLQPGSYTVIVDGYAGEAGSYRLTAVVVPLEGGPTAANDTCRGATTLRPDEGTVTDTFLAADDYRGSCVAQPGAPDVVFRLEVPSRSLVTASSEGLRGSVLYLQRTCGESATEVACGVGSLSGVVPAGTYFLVVDGQNADVVGSTTVRYELVDLAPIEAACSDLPILAAGEPVRGRTSGEGRFSATCGEGAGGPEAIYQLRLREPSAVLLTVEADFDCVLYVRRDCVEPGTEVGCNDDDTVSHRSRLDLRLDPGTYYVFVDGFGEGSDEAGSFTLRVQVTPR